MSASAQPSLFERALGDSYARLAAPLQRFHRLSGRHVLHGQVETGAPASTLARVLAWCLGTPHRAGHGALSFELDTQPHEEIWVRIFPSQTMRSRLCLNGRFIVEKLGAATLRFEVTENNGRLEMHLAGLRFLGIGCPRWLMPQVRATEKSGGPDAPDQLHFDIEAALPLAGIVASYRGWLSMPSEGRAG